MKIKLRDSQCAYNSLAAGRSGKENRARVHSLLPLAELYEQIKNRALSAQAWNHLGKVSLCRPDIVFFAAPNPIRVLWKTKAL
jgi:hypothetical protein